MKHHIQDCNSQVEEYVVVESQAPNTCIVAYLNPSSYTHVALTTTESDADKIAKALNEAEGL